MKKYLIGLIIGVGIAIPATASADYIVRSQPYANHIYNVNSSNSYSDTKIFVFDDSGNKCYVATSYNNTQPAISCVKGN